MTAHKRKDVYTRVTERIVADLEKGVRPWVKPWSADTLAGRITRPLRHNGEPYQGINVLMLWIASAAEGFCSPSWMTYRQAQQLGGQVRKRLEFLKAALFFFSFALFLLLYLPLPARFFLPLHRLALRCGNAEHAGNAFM